MTRDKREINKRGWLRVDHCAVTKSLRSIVEDLALPPREQERFAFIQNKVLITADEGRWAYIPRRCWKSKCGDNYKRYIQKLEEWGQLDSIRSYRASHDENAYPMPYWVPRPALREGLCSLEFRRRRFHAPVPDNHATDEASQYALKCLTDLSVATDSDFWLPEDPIRRSLIKHHCEHIFFKDFSLGYGSNSKRLFHRVVMMPAEGRWNLKHDFLPLVEYDVKSCHPLLLVTLFDDAGERKRYEDLLATDIYTEIGKAMGVPERERVKTAFLRVVNAEDKNSDWYRREYVLQFFQERFPHFTKSVLSVRTNLAITLQNLEAELMVQRLGTHCQAEGLFWFPQHDGWISTVSDGEIIKDDACKIISGAVGFPPTVTSQFLNGHCP
jgi:hypothetical protein